MTKEQRLAQFAKTLMKSSEIDELDKSFSTAIFYVEKELGAFIDEKYPLMKFFSQLEELQEHYKKEKEEYERINTNGIKK